MKETVIAQPQQSTLRPGAGAGATSPSSLAPVVQVRSPTASDYIDPMVIAVYGGPGAGKSRLLGTAKGAIGLIPTEHKSKGTVLPIAREFGREVVLPFIETVRMANPLLLAMMPDSCIVIGDAVHKGWSPGAIQDEMQEIASKITLTSPPPTCCKRHYYRWHVERVKAVAFHMAYECPNIATIGIDTFGTLVDDFSYANYGITGVIDPKEFGFAPREDMKKEIREFLNSISVKHLVLTHHMKGVWKDGKPVAGMNTHDGKYSGLGHHISVMIEMVRNDGHGPDEPGYYMKIKDCQSNASLIGRDDVLFDEAITFPNLAMIIDPDAPVGAFE